MKRKLLTIFFGISLLTVCLVFPTGSVSAGESGGAQLQAAPLVEPAEGAVAPRISVSAGGGTHNYAQRWSLGRVAQYSDYYHGSKAHRSTAMQNGSYYYSGGNMNTWYGGGSWAKAQGPWEWSLNTYNSYWATR